MYFAIDDGDGNQLTTGLPARLAREAAQHRADDLGRSVWLYQVSTPEDPGPFDSEEIRPSGFKIVHSHGVTETGLATYDDAVAAVRAVYSEACIGHDGDIPGGGERTLCWVDKATSVDDDGARTCCSIVRRHP